MLQRSSRSRSQQLSHSATYIHYKPFTKIEIIDQNPVQCLIPAENRKGKCKMIIRGKIPDELRLFASEIYQNPDEDNSTWVIDRPRVVYLHPKDTKAAILQSKIKGSKNDDKSKTFG